MRSFHVQALVFVRSSSGCARRRLLPDDGSHARRPAGGQRELRREQKPERRAAQKGTRKPASEAKRPIASSRIAWPRPTSRQQLPWSARGSLGHGVTSPEPPNLFVLWWEGGAIMYPITGMSFLVVLFACERFGWDCGAAEVIPRLRRLAKLSRIGRASRRPRSSASLSALQAISLNRRQRVARRCFRRSAGRIPRSSRR